MKQTIITRILNYVLVILGFASTASCEYIELTRCEYGMPNMDFEVSGKVVNQESTPIAGIRVSCSSNADPGYEAVLTAEDGTFSIAGNGMSAQLFFEDIDGPDNGGEYDALSKDINVSQVKKGDGNWYMGKYEAKDVVVEMTEKE